MAAVRFYVCDNCEKEVAQVWVTDAVIDRTLCDACYSIAQSWLGNLTDAERAEVTATMKAARA